MIMLCHQRIDYILKYIKKKKIFFFCFLHFYTVFSIKYSIKYCNYYVLLKHLENSYWYQTFEQWSI